MAYITSQNMIDEFGEDEIIQLTDRLNIGMIDDAALANALEFASSMLDEYAIKNYAVPIVGEINSSAIGHLCDIARYRLYDTAVTESVADNFKLAVKWLENIASGKASLIKSDGTSFDIPADGNKSVMTNIRRQVFNTDVMSQYDY